MKHLIILIFITLLFGVTFDDDNLYRANLPEITVVGDILEGYSPKRTKTEQEFMIHHKPLFQYIAKYTWLTEAQAFSFLRIEQGDGSNLFINHNNPFNIKGEGILCNTWEYNRSNKVKASFRSYKTLREGLSHFITLMNTKYHSKPLPNVEHSKWLYKKGYFTDPNYMIRSVLANKYEKQNNV